MSVALELESPPITDWGDVATRLWTILLRRMTPQQIDTWYNEHFRTKAGAAITDGVKCGMWNAAGGLNDGTSD